MKENKTKRNVIRQFTKGELFKLYSSHAMWLDKALQLKRSAEKLMIVVEEDVERIYQYAKRKGNDIDTSDYQHEPFIADSYFLLAGLSLENLLKGIILIEFPEIVSSGRFQDRIMHLHDLNKLATKAKVTLLKNEVSYCEKMTKYVTTWGKYSVPLDAEQMVVYESIMPRDFKNNYESLFMKLQNEMVIRCPKKKGLKDIP